MKLHFSFQEALDCEKIHDHTLTLLNNTGIVVHSEKARACYQHHGAQVDHKTVRLPQKLVEKYMKYAPESFQLRTGNHQAAIGGSSLCTMPAYGATYVRRGARTTLGNAEDFTRFTKLNQDNGLLTMACPYTLEPFDIPVEERERYKFAATLYYSDKPTFSMIQDGPTALKSIRCIRDFYDDSTHYLLVGNVNISSPMMMSEATGDVIVVHAEENQPLMIACGSGLSGLTAPPMPASTFLLSNAQIVAGIVLAQMIRPGLPVIYAMPLFAVNPVSAAVATGDPMTALFTMAASEMGKYYHLPTRAGGNFTDSKDLDYQNGVESFMNLFSTRYAGINCIMHTLGMEDAMNTISYTKYIFDEVLFQWVETYLGGFRINAVTLMPDEIEQRGCTENYINMRNLRLIRKTYHPFPFSDLDGEALETRIDSIITERLAAYRLPERSSGQKAILKNYLSNSTLFETMQH